MDMPQMHDGLKIRQQFEKIPNLREVPTSSFLMTISILESFDYQIIVCLKITWLQKQYAEGRKTEVKITYCRFHFDEVKGQI